MDYLKAKLFKRNLLTIEMERIENNHDRKKFIYNREDFREALRDVIFRLADEAYLEGKTETAIELVEGTLKNPLKRGPNNVWTNYRLDLYSSKLKKSSS